MTNPLARAPEPPEKESSLATALHDALSHYQGHVNPQTETHRVQHEYDARAVIEALERAGYRIVPESEVGLDALRGLSDAATPGPWRGCAHVNGTDPECPCRYEGDIWDGSEEKVVAFLGDCGCQHTDEKCRHLMVPTVSAEDREAGYANGRLIVAAVNYVRARLSDPSR